jgi:hypothetical protein
VRITLSHLPEQARFFQSTAREAALVGGLGYGKTHVASDWILAGAIRYPKARHFIFSNTFPQLMAGTMRTFFEACERWGLNYIDRVRMEHYVLLSDIGAKIEVRSADKPINYKSIEICRAWIDEAQAWPEMTYDLLLGRMRGTDTQRRLYPDMPLQVRLTANPPHSLDHWLVRRCTVPSPTTGVPPIELYTAATWDNPYLPQSYIDQLLEAYDPELAEIELGGKFGDLRSGRIWRRFDRRKHVMSNEQAIARGLSPLEYDPDLPICWSHDFNIDPLSSVLFQWRRVNVAGYQREVMYVLDELRIRDAMIDHAVREFVENRKDAVSVARRSGLILYGDPAGNQGNRQTGQSDWYALKHGLARYGLWGEVRVPAAPPLLRDRYNAANRMLENAKGEIGVIFHERCRWTVRDIEIMRYKPGTSLPDEKQKLEDGGTVTHLADAWSYAIAYEYPIREEAVVSRRQL